MSNNSENSIKFVILAFSRSVPLQLLLNPIYDRKTDSVMLSMSRTIRFVMPKIFTDLSNMGYWGAIRKFNVTENDI